MTLHPGDRAPLFVAENLEGKPTDLSALRGRRVLLSFYRAASCPLCSLRVWYLAQRVADWQSRGLTVLGIFESNDQETRNYCKEVLGTFPFIPDPQRRLFQLYDAQESLWGAVWGLLRRRNARGEAYQRHLGARRTHGQVTLMPMEFLLNPDLSIATAHYGRDSGDYLPFEQIEQFISLNRPSTSPTA